MMYDAFFIRPIRNITNSEKNTIASLVATLRDFGKKIYDPLLDTRQQESSLCVLRQNREGMKRSSEVLLWYSSESYGSIFDLGMAYYLQKPLDVINTGRVSEGPSFVQELIPTMLQQNSRGSLMVQKRQIETALEIPLLWKPTLDRIFYFGMAFASGKKISVVNRDSLQQTSTKSFENALLELTEA